MWTIGLQDRELTCWEEVRGTGPGRPLCSWPRQALLTSGPALSQSPRWLPSDYGLRACDWCRLGMIHPSLNTVGVATVGVLGSVSNHCPVSPVVRTSAPTVQNWAHSDGGFKLFHRNGPMTPHSRKVQE